MFTAFVITSVLLTITTIFGHRRIIGGSPAARGEFPFQVYMSTDDFFTLHCGGACMFLKKHELRDTLYKSFIISVLNEMHVLSAAHCFDNKRIKVNKIIVIIGVTDTERSKEYGVKRQINRLKVHEDFNVFTGENDIAFLELNKKVKYSNVIQPVILPEKDLKSSEDEIVTAIGWGSDESNICCSRHLLYVDLRVVNCKKNFSQNQIVTEKMLCVTGNSKIGGICYGDSGGSIVLKGTRTLVGIASFGNGVLCEKGQPDVLVRVSKFIDWIQKNIY